LWQKRKAIVHAERAAELARGVGVDERESYTIGYCAFIDLRFLAAIKRIKPIGPAHFVYHSAAYAEIVTKLEAHEWEAALMPLPVREKELVAEALFREPLASALPASHSLAKKREIELSDLRDESIILAPKCFGPGFRHQLIAPLEAAGVHWPVDHEATSPLEALHLVADGVGVTLAQQSVLESAPKGVVVRPIKGIQTEIETGIVFHCENDSLILAAFLDAVRETRARYLSVRGRELPISA
jgi:DNA-binding transcriptional LysR family regulator